MKHINAYRPDTCGCELHYEWDDATPEIQVPIDSYTDVNGQLRTTLRCEAHADIASHHEVHEHVFKENRTKNFFLKHVTEAHERFVDVEHRENGEVRRLKKGINYQFSFTGKGKERKMVAKLHGVTLTAGERKAFTDHAATLEKPVELI